MGGELADAGAEPVLVLLLLEVEVAFADDRPQTQLVYVPAPMEVNPLGCSSCSAWSTEVDLDV